MSIGPTAQQRTSAPTDTRGTLVLARSAWQALSSTRNFRQVFEPGYRISSPTINCLLDLGPMNGNEPTQRHSGGAAYLNRP